MLYALDVLVAGVVLGTLTVQFACTSFPDDFYCIGAISLR